MNLAVNADFTNAASDELRHLTSEINDQNPLVQAVGRFRHSISPIS
jgi:hypothetical protein